MPARLSLTDAQRAALMALPETEDAFVRHYSLSEDDRDTVARCRTPETRLAFALQLCVLRHPGRVLRHAEVIPFPLLAFIADQIGVSPDAITGFARRRPTRYEHLAALRARFGFQDLTRPNRERLHAWLAPLALRNADGLSVITALLEEMRRQRMIIPGVTVVEGGPGATEQKTDIRAGGVGKHMISGYSTLYIRDYYTKATPSMSPRARACWVLGQRRAVAALCGGRVATEQKVRKSDWPGWLYERN